MAPRPMAITVGTEIYYSGDMANSAGDFRVTAVTAAGLTLTETEGEARTFGNVQLFQIGDTYAGDCNPRFVTAVAVIEYGRRADNARAMFSSLGWKVSQ